MAITSGAGPHAAWLNVDGTALPIESGGVNQRKTRKSSSFSVTVPMSWPGALETLATVGDNTTTITCLTRGMTGTLFTGECDTPEFDFIARVIRVSGRDKSRLLHDNKTSEKWLNKKGSDIVQELAGRVGLPVQVDGSVLMAGKKLHQDYVRLSDNISFASIIHKISEFDGARWWIDPQGTLHYQLSNEPSGIVSLNYAQPTPANPMFGDFIHLSIRRSIPAGRSIKVSVKAWHPKKKQVFEYESNVEGNGGPTSYKYHIPVYDQDTVKQHAKSAASSAARHELTVHATVVGDPNINPGMGLQLNGTRFFDQLFELDDVHHQLGMSGHTTSLTARSSKSGRSAS